MMLGGFIFLGLSIYYGFDRRDGEVQMVLLGAKNFQFSSSTLIMSETIIERLIDINSSLYLCFFSIISLVGYAMFSIFSSSGFSFLGGELMKKHLFRPTLPKPEEHVLAGVVLRNFSEKVIEKARLVYSISSDLKSNRKDMEKIEAENKSTIMKKKMIEIEKDNLELKQMLDIYDKESDFQNENPLIYDLIAFCGILVYVVGFMYLVNNYYLMQDLYTCSDRIYYSIRTFCGMIFVFVFIFIMYVIIFMATYKGRDKIAGYIPDFALQSYNFEEDKTWTDDFLSITNIFLLINFVVVIGMTRNFPSIFSKTGIFSIIILDFSSVYPYSSIMNSFYLNACFWVFFFVGFFIVFFEPAPKQMLQELIKDKMEDLKEHQQNNLD